MTLTSTKAIEPGMIVMKDIFNSDGRVLITRGTELTQRYIEHLRKFNIYEVEVFDTKNKVAELIIDPIDVIKQELTLECNLLIRKLVRINAKNRDIMLLIEEFIRHLLDHDQILKSVLKIKAIGDGTIHNSLQVMIISLATGIQMDFSKAKLHMLAMASLLYDTGKMFLSEKLLLSVDTYSDEDIKQIKEHAKLGYHQLIQDYPEEIALVALQHHERYNGSGYPQGLYNKDIHVFARIVAVADAYITLKSPSNMYQKPFEPNEAMEYLLGSGGMLFDPTVTRAFSEVVAVYSLGSMVMINNGTIGVVSNIHRNVNLRPVIKTILDKDKKTISQQEIDLGKNYTHFIHRILD